MRPSASVSQSPQQAPDVVLYHAECTDGFGAAWAIWKKFPATQFIPVEHGNPPPGTLARRHVVVVDFSYPRPTLERIAADAASLLVLDHHITAQKALEGLPFARFEEKKSGAVMAWEWAHQAPPPWLLEYIQDKDLWTWSLPASREINAALASYPYDFQVWDKIRREVLETEGRGILRYESELVAKIAAEAVVVEFHGSTVPAVHSAVLTSQLGENLNQGYPFCVIWHERNGRRYFSLRSASDGADVSAIATAYGGGGHVHAAGFSIPLDQVGQEPAIAVSGRQVTPSSTPQARPVRQTKQTP
jgi:uncharacterized protein